MSEPVFETVSFLRKSKLDGIELFGGAFIVCTTKTGHTILKCKKSMMGKTINELVAMEEEDRKKALAKKAEMGK